MKAGAGGNWKRFNEKFNPSIPLQKGLSCVAAVGEMLLKERGIVVPYQQILDIIREKASVYDLAKVLNTLDNNEDGKEWIASYLPPDKLDYLLRQKTFGVILQEPIFLGHAVFIKEVNQNGIVLVYDSEDQTEYQMTKKDFNDNWGGGVIYREKNR